MATTFDGEDPANPVFLTVAEAAVLLRLSPVTLCRWRIEGGKIPFQKIGRRVLYERATVLRWAAEQTRGSTSERQCP